jgi:uncharacterized membrane protein
VSHGHGATARRRLLVAIVTGLVAGSVTAWLGHWDLAPLIGWDGTAVVLVGWVWLRIVRLDAEATAQMAVREDPTAAATDVLLLSAAVASLLAVGLVVSRSNEPGSSAALGRAGLGIASVVLSWALVHTVHTLRYAALYYSGPDGGIGFNQAEPPRYLDFGYVAFTVGMTFQVSDTALCRTDIRAVALRHALLSYLFGAVILASTINLVAGLAHG